MAFIKIPKWLLLLEAKVYSSIIFTKEKKMSDLVLPRLIGRMVLPRMILIRFAIIKSAVNLRIMFLFE